MRAGLASVGLLGVVMAGCSGASKAPEPSAESESPVCAGGATVNGIDVSYYQGKIDWNAAKQSGIDFAFARVSDGTGFIDPQFAANWINMKAAGVVRGSYQFFRPEHDPVAQANLLVAQIKAAGGLESGDLAPTIDVEVTDNVAVGTIVSEIRTWLQTVQAATGLAPTIYVSPGFWSTLGSPTGFGAYPLWVANWGVSCPGVPSSSWSTWAFWQNADTGNVPGVGSAPDLDKFNGSLAQLLAFAGGKGVVVGPTSDCQVSGVPGTCVDTSVCSGMAGYHSTAGHCPGAANIECCTPDGGSTTAATTGGGPTTTTSSTTTGGAGGGNPATTSGVGGAGGNPATTTSGAGGSGGAGGAGGSPPPTCQVDSVDGTCIEKTTCAAMTGYVSTPGFCPGAADIECCTAPTSCKVAGVAGVCIETALCSALPGHKSTPGYCPGAAQFECCTP